MFPWTHAAFGYLLVLAVAVVVRRDVSQAELAAVVTGTQFADVVDKPLAWSFAALPSGRSLAHSLLFAVPLCVLVLAVAWYRGQAGAGFVFGLGYASHLLGDTYTAIYHWQPHEFSFLLYPLLPAYPDEYTSFAGFASHVEVTSDLLVLFATAAALGVVFLAHFARAPRWHRPRSN
jgi:membrane-bound metal-dependent hydrolase YbcI (DUF457 family)